MPVSLSLGERVGERASVKPFFSRPSNLAIYHSCSTPPVARGERKSGATTFKAGKLGEMQIQGSDILLGKPFVFTKENIDQFDF